MTFPRALLSIAAICALAAWLSGPPGRLLVALPLLLAAPGFLIDRWLPGTPQSLFERPALWVGLSISVVALLYQWATALGLTLSAPALGTLAVACGAGTAWSIWRGPWQRPSLRTTLWFAALLALFGLTLHTRFAQIEGLALPAWVDSVHHALLIRVAVERGQAPFSLQPYMPIDQLPYHWGYHVVAAALVQLSGLPLPGAMLWSGQVFNALHVLTIAGLAAYLWRAPVAGIVGGLVVGLLSIMPAYYVSWGRYTQLVGLLLLPPLALAWHTLLRDRSPRHVVVVALLLAGLNLIHFRVLVFALCLMLAIGLSWAAGERAGALWGAAGRAALACGAGLALSGPWLALLTRRRLLPAIERPQTLASEAGYTTLSEGLLWAGNNRLLLALALAAGLWGLWRRSGVAATIAIWIGILVITANPWLLTYLLPSAGGALLLWGLQRRQALAILAGTAMLLVNPALVRIPSSWLITNDIVAISVFVPIAVLLGGPARALWGWAGRGKAPAGLVVRGAALAALAGLAMWGALGSREIVNPTTVLATEADLAAIAWAEQHTPPDARFLINATPWLNEADRGTDGGWWLLPLAGRWTSTPPAMFIYGPPAYRREVLARNRLVAQFQPGQEQQIDALIERERISHVYLGARPGPLRAALFSDPARFQTVYQRDGVTILAVVQQS